MSADNAKTAIKAKYKETLIAAELTDDSARKSALNAAAAGYFFCYRRLFVTDDAMTDELLKALLRSN